MERSTSTWDRNPGSAKLDEALKFRPLFSIHSVVVSRQGICSAGEIAP